MSLVMSRLRALEEPPSRLAVWARRLAVFSLVVAALAILIERAALLEIVPVLVTFGTALLAYPGYLAYQGYQLPAITDVTTDPIDPPRFEVVARLRPPNSSLYPGLT